MKFKFTTFLKIFGICFGSLIGVLGITLGIMKLAGAMDEPKIYPTAIYFQDNTDAKNNIDTYNVDNNFKVTVVASTEDVTIKDLTLSIITNGQVTEKDGKFTDGIITIPKTAKIGEPFEVVLNKTINDSECDNLEWIVGGHSTIRATSKGDSKQGKQEVSAKLNVNIDVPVYKIDVETRVSSIEKNTDAFVINSIINAGLKFYPARSAYQFSQNGEGGFDKVYKNAYFVVESLNDTKIEQQGHTNQFLTKDIGTSTIVGYCFKSTIKEQEVLKRQENLSDQAKYNNVMEELEKGLTRENPISLKNAKEIRIENINVDSMTVNANISNVYVDTVKRLYANKELTADDLSTSLGIKLLSTSNPTVSLQNKLGNVGIRFLIMSNGQYEDCVNNTNEEFNIIKMPEGSYSGSSLYQGNTYFKPVMTGSVDDYFWEFVVNENYADTIYIEIAYLDEEANITPQKLSFRVDKYTSENISWNLTSSQKNVTIKIFDNEDDTKVEYKEFDLKPYTVVPDKNLYKTIKYFVYFDTADYNGTAFENLIDCKPAVTYSIGSQTLNLYELEDGVIKAKSVLAHNLSFNCLFTTVQADYLGHVKLDENGKYIIDQYSKSKGVLDLLNVNIQKTLKTFNASLEYNGTEEDLTSMLVEDETTQISKFAFVQSLGEAKNYFDIAITQDAKDEIEKEIFKQAIANGEISIIAKLDGQEQNLEGSDLPLITFKQLALFEENDVYKQKYSVYVGELIEKTETKLEFYVRYKLTDDTYKDYKIECKFVKANNAEIAEQVANYIEIYNGEAYTFDFNLNLVSPTSPTNRVVISSDIVATGGVVQRIDRTFKLNDQDVKEDLFVVTGEDEGKVVTSKVNIVMKDKYGRLPIKYSYKLESSDPNVMVVNGDTFTLVDKDKDVNLILKKDGMQDKILYIHAGNSGRVSEVQFISETQDKANLKPIWSTETVYDDTHEEQYAFDLKTITIIGAKGTEIKFNDTTVGAINLVQYMYKYQDEVASLVSQVKVSLVEELDEDTLGQYITIDETGIIFTRNFGSSATIRLLASIADLGISQYITLDVRPNVQITITQPSTQLPSISGDDDGPKLYYGLYSEYSYEFSVSMSYTIVNESTANTDAVNYAFTVNDGERVITLTRTTTVAKLDTDNDFVLPDIDANGKRSFSVKIYFDSFSESQKKMTLSFGAHSNDKKVYDPYYDVYLYVTPNIEVELTSNILYFDFKNTPSGQATITGEKEIFGNDTLVTYPFKLTRKVGNTQFSNNIKFELDDTVSGYEITNYTLRCIKQLTSVEKLDIIVKYNDCKIATITVNVAPHIEMNNANGDWVLYDGEYYLKLVNDQTYDFDKIKDMFTFDTNGNVKDLSITENDYVSKTDTAFTVSGVRYSLISTTDDGNKLTIVVLLENGNSLTFKVMLFPVDMPFVNYEYGDLADIDLINLLDSNWLIENGYYTSIRSTGDDGEKFKYTIEELTNGSFGVQLVETDSVKYTLQTNDAEYASLLENGNIRIIPAGKVKYVTIFVNLNPLQSSSLIIPYVLRIEKELNLKVFYPYLEGTSDMERVDSQTLIASSGEFEREYLTSGDNGKVSIDLLGKQESFVPNKSQDSRRVAIYLNDNEYNGTSKGADIKFEVSKVLYSTTIDGMFFEAQDTKRFAYFSSGNNSGLLNINTNGNKQVRVEVKISTEGLLGYYYVSVGEIPTLKAYRNEGDQSIKDIEIKAGETKDLNYGLQKIITTGSSTITTDVTSLLQFYAYDASAKDEHITIEKTQEKYIISTKECTNNWSAKLMFYTIYGRILDINVNVQSNYVVKANENSLKDNSTIDKTAFKAYKYSNEDNDFTDEITNFDISEISIVGNKDYVENVWIDGNVIKIGAVKEAFDITFEISFNLGQDAEGNTITYTNTYKFTVTPQLFLNKVNSQEISSTNRFEVSNDNVVTNDSGSQVSIKLVQSNTKIELLSPFVLVGQNVEDWQQNFTGFRATLISEVALKEYYKAEINGLDLTISTPLVVEKTVVSYRIEYINILDGNEYTILTAYIVFTLNPNFKVETNYPQASSTQSATTDEAREYFYINYNGAQSDTINLNKQALLASDRRFVITKIASQDPADLEYSKDNVYIKVSGYDKDITEVKVNNSEVVEENKYYAFDTNFGFVINQEQAEIRFAVYLKIEEQYFEIGHYLVTISNNLSKVWSVNKYNFNASSPNDQNNPELIYLGSNDEPTKTVRLNIKISSSLTDTSKKYYLGIKELFGVSVKQNSNSFVSNNASSVVDVYFKAINTEQMTTPKLNKDITEGFTIYDENGDEILDDTIKGAISYQILSIQTRIELKYNGIVCDIDKLYKITNISEMSFTTVAGSNTGIKAGKLVITDNSVEIDSYYVQEILDAEFEKTNFEVSTGNKVNIIKGEESKYDNVSAGLKRKSNNTYYTIQDLSDNESKITVEQTDIFEYYDEDFTQAVEPKKGFLRVTPIASTAGDKNLDYQILALGAPNEPVYVKVVFKITIDKSSEEYVLIFKVSADYQNLTLHNTDGSQNSETNPCTISALNDNSKLNSKTFATSGDKALGDNLIYIEHANDGDGVIGNIIPLFKVTQAKNFDDNGDGKIHRLDDKDKLTFYFDKVSFGNVKIKLVFEDDYGYTFDYYITIRAIYNPIYNSGTLSFFEEDILEVINNSSGASKQSPNVLVPINFEKDIDANINLNDLVIKSVTFMDSNKQYIDDFAQKPNELKFKINSLNILASEVQVEGTLKIELVYAGSSITLSIPSVVKALYTIKTIDDKVYVRDGVPFDILDVIEVIDNKSSAIKVGERSLEKSDSVAIDYNISGVGSNEQMGITFGLRMADKTTDKIINDTAIGEPILDSKSGKVFASLQDTFDITSLENYTFQLILWDSLGRLSEPRDADGKIYLSTSLKSINIKLSKYCLEEDKDNPDKVCYYLVGNEATIITESDKYIRIEENNCSLDISLQMIKDQILKIGLRNIDNYDNNKITVYFENNSTLKISGDSLRNETISLVGQGIIKSGEYTSFLTGRIANTDGDMYINNGLSQDDIRKLKDIKLELSAQNDEAITEAGGLYTLNLKDFENGETWNTVTINQTNIVYQQRTIRFDISYAKNVNDDEYSKGDAEHPVSINVTLKYVDVDKTYAYGSNVVKFVNYRNVDAEGNVNVDLNAWAGISSTDNAFMLNPGYSNAIVYSEDDLYLPNNVDSTGNNTSGRLAFGIHSTDTVIDKYARINKDTGMIELDSEFDLAKNYLEIDIYVKYGQKSKQLISTVKLAFRKPEIQDIEKTSSMLVVENGKAKISDILNLFKVKDKNNNYWSGKKVLDYFNGQTSGKIYFVNGEDRTNILDMDYSSALSITASESISIEYGTTTLTDYKMTSDRYTNGSAVKLNVSSTDVILAKEIPQKEVTVGEGQTQKVYDWASLNANDELAKEIAQFVRFVDIYGDSITYEEIEQRKNDGTNTTTYTYEVSKTPSSGDLYCIFTFEYYYNVFGKDNVIISTSSIGSVKVIVYNTNSNIEVTETKIVSAEVETYEVSLVNFDNINYAYKLTDSNNLVKSVELGANGITVSYNTKNNGNVTIVVYARILTSSRELVDISIATYTCTKSK